MGGCAHYCTQALSVSVLVSGEDVWQGFPTGERDDSHPSYPRKIPCLFLPPLFTLFRRFFRTCRRIGYLFGGQTQYTTRRTRLSQYLAACGASFGVYLPQLV